MDEFSNNADAVTNPARGLIAITPNDGADLPAIPKALYVGSAGDLRISCIEDASPVVLKNVGEGQILPVRARRVHATGTTAAAIVAFL